MNLAAGTRLGAYSVVSALGSGGMGEVYRARDSRLGRDVAIKVLLDARASDPQYLKRFGIEAHAIAALNHPNIITVFDVDTVDGMPFIATELVDGETLRDRLARGPMALREVVDIAAQIAEGLAHAHDGRIVHRDLKPQNVMIKPDGLVKIVDFGLGKFLGDEATADAGSTATTLSGLSTGANTILGTAGYMSPEQITGRPVDGRSDQFAFGAVLYEMLTGTRAFTRETTIETISSVLSTEPKPVTALAPSTPPALVAILERCLSKRPDDRYASTRDLARDLRDLRHDLVGTRTRTRPLSVGRRTVGIAAALLAIVMVAALSVLLIIRQRSEPPKQIAVLPFTNVQRDPANDAFADGIVELLTTNLTTLERSNETLRVVPASDVRRYGVSSAKEARQTFGANLVVSGSIQRAGDIVRLTLNLIDPETLQQRQARVIDARADNPLALQDEAFSVLAGMLGAAVQADARNTLRAGGTAVPSAYDFYVQGRGYLQRFERVENVNIAIDLFERAIQQDDRFALAHAALGEALWRKYERTKDESLIAQARAACGRATALNDKAAAVHVTLALIARGTGEYETAVVEAKRAIALDSMAADGRRELARAYESLNQFDLAEATYKEAIATRPGDWTTYSVLGAFYASRKRYDEALVQLRRVVELAPDNATAYSDIGGVQFFLKRYDEARQSFERSVALKPTAAGLSNLGTLYFRLHRDADAAAALERALQVEGSSYRVWANLGAIYGNIAGADDRSQAAYREAIELGERERATNPRRPALLADLAGFYGATGQVDQSRRYLESALAAAPDDPTILYKAALTVDELGDRQRAISLLSSALRRGYPRQNLDEDRAFARLKSDPRVVNLIATQGDVGR